MIRLRDSVDGANRTRTVNESTSDEERFSALKEKSAVRNYGIKVVPRENSSLDSFLRTLLFGGDRNVRFKIRKRKSGIGKRKYY